MWGVIAVGLFAKGELMDTAGYVGEYEGLFFGGSGNLLAAQVTGLLWIAGWVTAVMTPFFLILNALGMFRVDAIEEDVGLDISHHRGAAYDYAGAKKEDVEELLEMRASRHGKVEAPKEVAPVADVAPIADGASDDEF